MVHLMNAAAMFEVTGPAIGKRPAPETVKPRADVIAASKTEDRLADAIARFGLPHASKAWVAS
jgi:hypothetical protein